MTYRIDHILYTPIHINFYWNRYPPHTLWLYNNLRAIGSVMLSKRHKKGLSLHLAHRFAYFSNNQGLSLSTLYKILSSMPSMTDVHCALNILASTTFSPANCCCFICEGSFPNDIIWSVHPSDIVTIVHFPVHSSAHLPHFPIHSQPSSCQNGTNVQHQVPYLRILDMLCSWCTLSAQCLQLNWCQNTFGKIFNNCVTCFLFASTLY